MTAIAKMTGWSGRGGGLLRGCVAAVCLAVVIAAAGAGTAAARARARPPALGRWSGRGPGGEIQFYVSRVRGSLVLSNLVVSCSTAAGATADTAATTDEVEEPIERNGTIYSYVDPAPVSGKLHFKNGRVTAQGDVADQPLVDGGLGGCPAAGLRHVRVTPSGARAVTNGTYAVTGALGTYGTARVYGKGALLEYDADFPTPVGTVENDPEGCAAMVASSTAGPILPAADGSFSAHTVFAVGFVATTNLTGRFVSTRSAIGVYSATWIDGDVADCAGDGPFALVLVHAGAPLEPIRPPKPERGPKPEPPGPTGPDQHRCAMRFQVQQGKRTPHSEPVSSAHPITVQEALDGLDALEAKEPRRMRKASVHAFEDTRTWVRARRPRGVSEIGNVHREWFSFEKKSWRLDTENLRCTNLTH